MRRDVSFCSSVSSQTLKLPERFAIIKRHFLSNHVCSFAVSLQVKYARVISRTEEENCSNGLIKLLRCTLENPTVAAMNVTKREDQERAELDIERQVDVCPCEEVPVPLVETKDEDTTFQENEEDSPDVKSGITTMQETSSRHCWCDHPRVKQLYTTADWWSLWIGLATFLIAIMVVFAVPYEQGSDRVKYVMPQPMKWKTNPLDAWDVYNFVGTILLLLIFGAMYILSCKLMGKLDKKEPSGLTYKYLIGFATMATLATVSFWIGRNEWCANHGLGYAVFAIILGMAVTNSPLGPMVDETLAFTAKDGEFFIKCSLVLLAVQLDALLQVGVPGIAVAWIGSPLAIIIGYIIGTRYMKCEDSLALLTCVGASWCGASAISAVAPIVSAKSEDVSLAISVVAFFTLGFTFIQPYFAMGVGMNESVAGAWIGASVDQTGNVIVSAAIISDEATEVAGIIKMVLNSGLGIMASIIACWWNSRNVEGEEKKPFSLVMLWDKFPKFTIGFLITSAVLTGAMLRLEGTAQGDALPRAVSTLNKWWFAIAFVGIGLTTNIRKLWDGAVKSGIIQVYLIANAIDIALALGLAYLLF